MLIPKKEIIYILKIGALHKKVNLIESASH